MNMHINIKWLEKIFDRKRPVIVFKDKANSIEDYKGKFHKYMTKIQKVGEIVIGGAVALIEDPQGRVEMVTLDLFNFTDIKKPPKQ